MTLVRLIFQRLISLGRVLMTLLVWVSSASAEASSVVDNFDNHLYVTKVCREVSPQDRAGKYDANLNLNLDLDLFCKDGYVLKSERLADGQVRETIVMDDIPSTLWYRTTLKRLDNDTYLMHLSCGNYCGGNTLIGRGNQEQDFGWWFTYDVASRCTAEFDHDKMLWVARPFFSDKAINLPKTAGASQTAAGLKYTAEFTQTGQLMISEFIAPQPKFILPNPCQAVKQ